MPESRPANPDAPAGTLRWDVQWQGGRFTAPDGTLAPPRWGTHPDLAAAHRALDEWAESNQLREKLPALFGWTPWWYLRFILAHDVLFRALPAARALAEVREQYGVPGRIRLHHPPAPWWPQLVALVFPEANVDHVRAEAARRLERMQRIASRMVRALVTRPRLRRLAARPADRPRVVVLCQSRYWDGARDTHLHGVIDALDAEGYAPVVLVQSHSGNAVGLRGVRTRPRSHLFCDIVYWRAMRKGLGRERTGWELPGAPLMLEGLDFAPLVRDFIAKRLAALTWEQGVFTWLVPELLAKIGAQAVVLLDENGAEHFFHMGCVRAGVPTVAVQHGCIHGHHLHYIYPHGVAPEDVPLARKTCVFGAHYADLLTQHSVYPSGAVEVTGSPQVDAGQAVEVETAAREFRRRVLPEGCDTLLLLTSQDLLHALVGPRFLEALRHAPRRFFAVVRPHPREFDARHWDRYIADSGTQGRVAVLDAPPLDVMLAACDAHLSASSTVLGEAVLYQRPSIVVGGRAVGDWMGVLEAGVAVDLDDFPSLEAAVAHWLDAAPEQQAEFAARREAYAARHFHVGDGPAPQRIAGVVRSVIEGP